MEKVVLKTNLSCMHCVIKVDSILKNTTGIADYSIDLQHPDKLVTISSDGADVNEVISKFKDVGYRAQLV